ncbi:MAG: HAMP domain-containing histidine kinase [Clostridiaceae bacterium]|nr:HAMP domain-containing histidine kinase [Clostridiaceae bacterium]
MTLRRKTFLYSILLTIIIGALFLGYILIMLPDLYVADTQEQFIKDIKKVHLTYIEEGNYKNITPLNYASTISIDFYKNEDRVTINSKAINYDVNIQTEEQRQMLANIRSYFNGLVNNDKKEFNYKIQDIFFALTDSFTHWTPESKQVFLNQFQSTGYIDTTNDEFPSEEINTDFFQIDDKTIIISSTARIGDEHYVSNIGFTNNTDRYIMTIAPQMQPSTRQILPVTIRSLPMVAAVLILVVLIGSLFFAQNIVRPIVNLSNQTEALKYKNIESDQSVDVTGTMEIEELAENLNRLYQTQQSQFRQLKQMGERQRIFLQSSSHQLKTPLAAALMLTDGMIHKIGKYKDTETYLLELKQQLRKMETLISTILSTNHLTETDEPVLVDIAELAQRLLEEREALFEQRQMEWQIEGAASRIVESTILTYILENLIDNAINHGKPQSTLTLRISDQIIQLENSNASIDEELLPYVFEPFVTGEDGGHGMGLYLVRYYATLIQADVNIENLDNSVLVTITFQN